MRATSTSELTTEALTANAFSLVSATYNGSGMDIYVDGNLVASGQGSLSIPSLPAGTPVMVGGPAFAGSMEEVAVDGSALSGSEVEDQYAAGATPPPANDVSYSYDGQGLLTGVTTLTGTATDTWGTTAGLPLLLSDATNDYLYGPSGTPVEQASLATGKAEFFVSGDQGSTRALLGASGEVVATFTYGAYGSLASSSGGVSTPLLYDGQVFDPTTGLYYLRARWYDPATDQFMSVDPLVAETGQPYAYAGDDPVNEGDPLGLFCWGLCSFANAWNDTGRKVVHYAATHTVGLCANSELVPHQATFARFETARSASWSLWRLRQAM